MASSVRLDSLQTDPICNSPACCAAYAAERAVGGLSDTLETPTPYAAADVITHDESGRLSFHYAIVEVQLFTIREL